MRCAVSVRAAVKYRDSFLTIVPVFIGNFTDIYLFYLL